MSNKKEEILNDSLNLSEIEFLGDNLGNVYKAMDIYAKEVAIEFFKFYIWKATGFLEYLRNVKPMVTSNEIEENLKAFEGKSLNELYELFLQSKKQ